MTAPTRRQIEILRIVFTHRRLNTRAIADRLGSPTRLSGDLIDLVQKRCLRMEREGKEHIYMITTTGLRSLAHHETDIAEASIDRLRKMDLPKEALVKLLDKLKQNVRITWCEECGGTNTDWDGILTMIIGGKEVKKEIETCVDCHNANLLYGTLSEYETFLKEKGLFNEKGFMFKLHEDALLSKKTD